MRGSVVPGGAASEAEATEPAAAAAAADDDDVDGPVRRRLLLALLAASSLFRFKISSAFWRFASARASWLGVMPEDDEDRVAAAAGAFLLKNFKRDIIFYLSSRASRE